MDYIYRFPVVRGIQANREYYIAMVPLKMISRLFPMDEEYVEPEYRAQRKLNETRVPIISKYIIENRDTYVFSALAASIDGRFKFICDETRKELGVLEISMDARFLINDGQHRKAAILEALKEDSSLENETIPIVFFADLGLTRSQQIFTDLNKNAVKTSNSISELYDSRDRVATITRTAIKGNPFLNTFTDKEKDNLGKFSSKLFTLNMFYNANKTIIGRQALDEKTQSYISEFWDQVTVNMVPWQEMKNKEITKKDLRESYIATQGIVLQALGRVGNYFYEMDSPELEKYLCHLRNIDWSRTNREWSLRAIKNNGRIITNQRAAILIGNVIKKVIGIKLTSVEETAEQELRHERGDEGDT